MSTTQPVVDHIIQQIKTTSRMQALLDSQPFLDRFKIYKIEAAEICSPSAASLRLKVR